MAIEIVPEKKETSNIQKMLLVASVLFFVASIGLYFYFADYIIPQRTTALSKANASLAALTDSTMDSKEAEIKQAQQYISDFKILYNNNPKASKFFDSFQKWANPKISYSTFSLDVDGKKVTLKGTASGFQNIMQQIASLKTESTIDSYNLANVQMSETGQVSFDLNIVLKSNIFQ